MAPLHVHRSLVVSLPLPPIENVVRMHVGVALSRVFVEPSSSPGHSKIE